MSHHYSPNSSILSVHDGNNRSASDVCDGTELFSYANGDFRRGHVRFAAELGSAVEETVASIVTRHRGSGIDKSLAWEAIQSLARSKLDGLTGSLIAQGGQGFYTPNNFISDAGASLLSPENAGSMNHDVPLMTDLDAFFPTEQPPGFKNVQDMEVPELGHAIYDDGPFSLWQMPIPSPSSGTITLPTNTPSLQEPWPDGNSVDSSATGSTRTITATPASRRHGAEDRVNGLVVLVARFRKENQDALTHVLFRGTEAGMITPRAESTAFSLENGTLIPEKIDAYCDSLAFDLALNEGRQATDRNRLASHILMFATTQCAGLQEEPSIEGIGLVRLALRFWAMQAVFFKYPWTIVKGASEIGMCPLDIPGCWFGKTLLPRLVNQQLDKAFEIRMDELEREILGQLEDMILYRKRSTYWCAIFLTTFILLHSLEKDSWNMHAWEYEKNRNGGTRWPLRRDPCDYYGQNKHIADTLTAYFHIVTNGNAPFAIDWTKSSNESLLSDSSQARSLIEGIQKDLQNPQSNYGRELHASSEFRRDDVESLNYYYTKKLILGQDKI
ncbi:hypothetical protein ACKAV7_007356 [Fusarium commune]